VDDQEPPAKKCTDATQGFRGHELDRAPRRVLAARILAVLEHHGVSYGVLRNPNRLLYDGQGDLDIWIPSQSIQSAIDLIEREAEAAGWWLLKRVRRPYVCSLYLYRPGSPASALTVDAFPAIRWLVADLLSEDLLVESRIREGNVWIVDPRVGALASCLHHLAWNGRVPYRYLETYLRVGAGDDLPYSRLVQRLAKDGSPLWSRYRRRLLISAVSTSVIVHPMRTAAEGLRAVMSLAGSLPGRWVALDGPVSAQYLSEIDRRLHEEHFLVGRWGSIDRVPRGPLARMGWYTRNVLIKRRLGATVLSSGDPGNLRPDARVWASRSGWEAQPTRPGDAAHQGEHVEDLFHYLLHWLASECRIRPSGSRHTNGIIVGLAGADRSGRSTLARRLEAEGLEAAPQYYWRPGTLPKIRNLLMAATVKSDPPPETKTRGSLVSLGRLAHYWIDTQLGFATTLRRQRRAGLRVLVERSLLDVVVDPNRYGLRLPHWVLELAARVSLKPQLLLNISSSSYPPLARNAELSIADPERQVQVWCTFPLRLVDTRNLDASAAPIDLTQRAIEIIAGALPQTQAAWHEQRVLRRR
jgi:hypothetical protein